MKKSLFILIGLVSIVFTGCLEIEQGVILNNDGSGRLALKTDMSQLMSMMSMMGKQEKISKDTVINYKAHLDTAKSLTPAEKDLVSRASWHIKMNSDDGVMELTLNTDFKNMKEIDQLLAILAKWDNSDIVEGVFKDLAPGGAGGGMDDMGMGGGNKDFSDMTKNYFKTDWQNGKLSKKLDEEAYKKINDDENLNSFKQLGALAGGSGDEMLEKINLTTKFLLPQPAKKVEGKNVKLSDDKKTVTITCPVSDIYTAPKNFEYQIEY